jgi:hypothetical protein
VAARAWARRAAQLFFTHGRSGSTAGSRWSYLGQLPPIARIAVALVGDDALAAWVRGPGLDRLSRVVVERRTGRAAATTRERRTPQQESITRRVPGRAPRAHAGTQARRGYGTATPSKRRPGDAARLGCPASGGGALAARCIAARLIRFCRARGRDRAARRVGPRDTRPPASARAGCSVTGCGWCAARQAVRSARCAPQLSPRWVGARRFVSLPRQPVPGRRAAERTRAVPLSGTIRVERGEVVVDLRRTDRPPGGPALYVGQEGGACGPGRVKQPRPRRVTTAASRIKPALSASRAREDS